MWEIITRSVPYEHLRTSWAIRDFVVGGGRPVLPAPTLTHNYNRLMQACWVENQFTRPTFTVIVHDLERIRLPAAASLGTEASEGAAASV